MTQAVSRLALSAETQVLSRATFVADTVALEQVFLKVLWFSPVSVTPPRPHTRFHLQERKT